LGHYCGGLCIEDPEKRNPQLFWPDGRQKTIAERGLSLTDEERRRAQEFVRRMGTGATVEPEKPVALPVDPRNLPLHRLSSLPLHRSLHQKGGFEFERAVAVTAREA
jgi:hypothetical protein